MKKQYPRAMVFVDGSNLLIESQVGLKLRRTRNGSRPSGRPRLNRYFWRHWP